MNDKSKAKSFNSEIKVKSKKDNKNDPFEYKDNIAKPLDSNKSINEKKNLSNSINFILFWVIFMISPKYILSNEHFIKLKVNEIGYNQILSDDFKGTLPSVIYINNDVQVLREKKVYVANKTYEIKLQWDSYIYDFTYMFSNLASINSVYMYYISGSYSNMSYMFYNCKNLVSFSLDKYSNDYIVDTIGMFYNCISLTSFLSNNFFYYSYSYRNLSYMFYNCQSLSSLSLYSSYINDMRGMFYNCTSLTSINLDDFQTRSNYYANSSYLFYNCSSLASLTFYNNYFHTNDMQNMFYNCQNLSGINLYHIRTSSPINVSRLFYNCSRLSSLYTGYNNNNYRYNLDNIIISDTREMFYNCTSLNYISGYNYNYRLNIYIYNSDIRVNMSNMFYNCKSLETINIYGTNYNIYATDFHSMFYNCFSLTNVYIQNLYFDYIQDMSYMFYNCKRLNYFSFGNFYLSSIRAERISMKGMFQNCESLTSLDLNSNFYTKNVEIMWDMFNGCSQLKSLDLGNFDTSKVTDMESMFEGCSSLTVLSLNSFNTNNVQYMNKMFYNCVNLQSLYFSKITTNSLGTMHQMFYNCKNLKYLNLFSLTEKDQSISEMFKEASTTFTFCIEDEKKIPKIFKELFDMSGTSRDCSYGSNNCYNSKRVSISSKKLCCPNMEFNNSCYDRCPSRTRVFNYDNKCKNFSCPYSGLNYNYKYYTFDQGGCRDNIPEGYFLNDTRINTIDKCHEDCRTCDKKETDESHTNCLSCKSGKPNIYLGNCFEKCLKGNYTENGYVKCKCFDERCFKCTEESIKEGLCTQCNTNYHAKIEDKGKSTFKCYQNPEKFYLSGDYYHPCHPSCLTCNTSATSKFHNCLTCDVNNSFPISANGYSNCYPNCTHYFYFDKNDIYTCTDSADCPTEYNLFVPEIGQCVKSCLDTFGYQYEFGQKCYRYCPGDSVVLDAEKKTCKLSCPFERPFMLGSNCVSNCTINERQFKYCVTNYFGNRTNAEIQDIILADIEEHLTSHKYNFSVIREKSIVIEEENTNYELTTTENVDENAKTSTLDLSLCEDALREFYSIPKQEPIYILKYDIYIEGKEGPTVRYRVFYPLENSNVLEALDLTICENLPVIISLPANITGNPDLYDKNSAYYNDLCVHYSIEGGADMTLQDRQQQYIQNNKSLCEEDCNFAGYDKQTGKVDCSCEVKFTLPLVSEIKVDKNKLYKFMDIKKIANFDVLKCWKLITSKVGIVTNIGFYFYFPALITYVLSVILFYAKEFMALKIQVKDIIYSKVNQKYIHAKKKKLPKPPKKIKPKPKFVQPIFVQMMEKIIEEKEAQKNIDPEIKKKKAILVSQIMKNIGKSDILQNKKEDLIEEKNINNEKKEKEDENNINNEIIEKKEKIPRNINNKNKINAPPIKGGLPKINDDKKTSNKTEGNFEKSDIPSSRNNLQLNQNGLNLITRNVDNENKGSGILSKTEEEKIMITLKYNDSELNVLDFKEALKYDNRNYFQYYLSLLKTKHLIVKVINKTDYNSRMIKIFLIFFNFALCFTVNALFFSDDTMHKILEDGGDFNFIYQLPQIIYSAIISFIFENILGFLAMSEENILSIKHEKVIRNIKRKAEDVMRNLQMKFLCFFILSFFFLIGFWYYATCFCAVYTKTQFHLIKDVLISFGTSLLTPLGLNLLPGLVRIPALKTRKEVLYLFSKILQLF